MSFFWPRARKKGIHGSNRFLFKESFKKDPSVTLEEANISDPGKGQFSEGVFDGQPSCFNANKIFSRVLKGQLYKIIAGAKSDFHLCGSGSAKQGV